MIRTDNSKTIAMAEDQIMHADALAFAVRSFRNSRKKKQGQAIAEAMLYEVLEAYEKARNGK